MNDAPDQVIVTETGQTTVSIDGGVDTRSVVVDGETISIVTAQIPGPPGVGSDKHYEQAFAVSNTVTVNHNLGKYPAVTVIDSAGDEILVAVEHVNNNTLVGHGQDHSVVLCFVIRGVVENN